MPPRVVVTNETRPKNLSAKLRRPASLWVTLTGSLCLLIAAIVAWIDPGSFLRNLREASFDRMLSLSPRSDGTESVVIVDIGREALATIGPWPWPRDRLAAIVNKIADAEPKAFAMDILLAAREPDPGDTELGAALARMPSVLAILLDPEPTAAIASPSAIAVSGNVSVPDLLVTPGTTLPDPQLL